MKLSAESRVGVRSCEQILSFAIGLLPARLGAEVKRITDGRLDCPDGLSEIRVRRGICSSVVISGENLPLFTSVNDGDLGKILERATGGSVYAHSEELHRGYVSLPMGIRLGVCISRLGGTSSTPLSIAIRLPLGRCSFSEELFGIWQGAENGLLLFSEPGGGKTTALRDLAAQIASREGRRVVIIDERGEFYPEYYDRLGVDILAGYPKAVGIELALRSLAPEAIVTDEIGSAEEARAIAEAGRGGVKLLASAHAGSLSELMRREGLRLLLDSGFFDKAVRLIRHRGKFYFEGQDVL